MSQLALRAHSEDEAIVWYDRSTTTSRAARRDAARLWMMKPWQLRVRGEHMRPHDCAVDDTDLAREDGTCWCFYEDEGWHYVCDADHPAAIAVWRVIPITAPAWWWTMRRRLRQLHPAFRHGRLPAPVLWGGRVERKPNRLERLLLGRSFFLVPGGAQHRLHQGEIAWCDSCGRRTLHYVNPHRLSCSADDHYRLLEEESRRRPQLRAVADTSPNERQEAP